MYTKKLNEIRKNWKKTGGVERQALLLPREARDRTLQIRRTSLRLALHATSREAPAGVKYRFARARHEKLNLAPGATRRVESRPEMAPKLRRDARRRVAPTYFGVIQRVAPIIGDAPRSPDDKRKRKFIGGTIVLQECH